MTSHSCASDLICFAPPDPKPPHFLFQAIAMTAPVVTDGTGQSIAMTAPVITKDVGNEAGALS